MRTDKDMDWIYKGSIPFETLKGKIITKIENLDDRVDIYTNDGRFTLINFEEWCGNDVEVYLEYDEDNDWDRILNSEILFAEEVTDINEDEDTSYSFYKLSVNNDSITLRFYGRSNGYYSESMQLYRS